MLHPHFISDYLTSSKNVVNYRCQFTFGPMNKIFSRSYRFFPGNERILIFAEIESVLII